MIPEGQYAAIVNAGGAELRGVFRFHSDYAAPDEL